MTARDDALLAPAAVRVVEKRAQQVWRVGIGVAVVMQAVLALTFGPSWPVAALVLFLSVLVVSGWAWRGTARTLRAASERTTEATSGRRSTVTRWSRAVRHDRFTEIEPGETPAMVQWAQAAVVRARLAPYGLGGLWVSIAMLQVVNLSLNPLPFTGGTAAQTLLVALAVGLFATAWAQHRRHRLRLGAFLDGLDPRGPAADRP